MRNFPDIQLGLNLVYFRIIGDNSVISYREAGLMMKLEGSEDRRRKLLRASLNLACHQSKRKKTPKSNLNYNFYEAEVRLNLNQAVEQRVVKIRLRRRRAPRFRAVDKWVIKSTVIEPRPFRSVSRPRPRARPPPESIRRARELHCPPAHKSAPNHRRPTAPGSKGAHDDRAAIIDVVPAPTHPSPPSVSPLTRPGAAARRDVRRAGLVLRLGKFWADTGHSRRPPPLGRAQRTF
ncbi:hypothetical protein EVAR_36157_1 [Eumeta japonica]|uniref:Uncharacterized protein n=1 Tax=Eumeta variegata TaxID=151549 RepID=A0A4C1X5L8_EUMVA|nr:hypothetical protein EVAR_36157_1 [Eumeta japonica]